MEEEEEKSSSNGLQRSYNAFPSSSSSSLNRHSSTPAGFLNHLATANINGFSITNALGSYNSQLSFTRNETLSRISEENESSGNGFGTGSWDEKNNPITFSVASSKRSKMNITSDFDHSMESQFGFSISEALEMDNKLLQNIPQDSVPCKIRAKRGCATHPRSIAERERRTRISGKLKKLQDLVPNMDKQTSYADMLDLAVQHIKTLQNQVQKLNEEVDNCKCGCIKNTTNS